MSDLYCQQNYGIKVRIETILVLPTIAGLLTAFEIHYIRDPNSRLPFK
jgi:hypothetical protein